MRYLRGFAFELMHVAGRRAIDGNSPWLHRLGDFPDKFDSQQTILECGVLHLNVISEVELPLEWPRGNTSIEIFALGLVRLVALDGDYILLGRHRDFVRPETCNRKRNLVAVVA